MKMRLQKSFLSGSWGFRGTLQRLILTGERGYDINPMEIEVSAGRITVTMPKTSSMILQYRTEEEEKPVKPKNRRSFWEFG